jgi:hypothetical protein
MRVRSKHRLRLLFAVHGRSFGAETSPLLFTPNGCSRGPARCGARESSRFSLANPYHRSRSRTCRFNNLNRRRRLITLPNPNGGWSPGNLTSSVEETPVMHNACHGSSETSQTQRHSTLAVRLAGEVRWFDNRSNADLPYDVIVSTFEACFDSTRTLYPGSRDRAYYSGRAMMWIHTLADCKSEGAANRFPLPDAEYTTTVPDPDLEQLLQANSVVGDANRYIDRLLAINPGHTPSHSQWISNLLLHHSWANRTELDYERILYCFSRNT